MKFQTIIYFTISTFIFSCNSPLSNSPSKTNETENSVQLSNKVNHKYMHVSNTIDTSNYDTLPYWNAKIRQYSEAYVDTFSVDGIKFRFVNPKASHMTGLNSLRLQQLVSNQWYVTNLELDDNISGGRYSYSKDINGDDYNDITNDMRFTQEVYFFNPESESFFDSSLAEINPDWNLLDGQHQVYCDFQEFLGLKGQISSSLYTFKNFRRYELYHLELYNGNDNGTANLITKLQLSKCVSGSSDSLIKLKVTKLSMPIDTDAYDRHGMYSNGTDRYFDYVNFWKQRYTKLLKYR